MKKAVVLIASIALSVVASPAAIAQQCQTIASFTNPNPLRCEDTGRQNMYGKTIWFCC
jgi:hypothetical protein